MKNWNVYAIEAIAEEEAKELAIETMIHKGMYNIYFVDFKGYFGYSYLAFANGRHIYHANDYQLHRSCMTLEELKEWYIDEINHKLFVPADFETVEDYNDYDRKCISLINYYPLMFDSSCRYSTANATGYIHHTPYCFSYTFKNREDAELITRLGDALKAAKNNTSKDNYDYWKKAFRYEMDNHEYAINLEADENVLGVFGLPFGYWGKGHTLKEYFEYLKFSDIQIRAYFDARSEHMKAAEEW